MSLAPGVVAGITLWVLTRRADASALAGWDVAAAVFLVRTWRLVGRLDGAASAHHAEREDPTHALADAILLGAAVASIAGVGLVLAGGNGAKGGALVTDAALAVGSLALSWGVVHTVFALVYARLYYEGTDGGVDFHGDERPTYVDFAYLAFTVGMTFQVSDTEINSSRIRAAVLRQALLAYLFGAVIIAATINLLAGLSK